MYDKRLLKHAGYSGAKIGDQMEATGGLIGNARREAEAEQMAERYDRIGDAARRYTRRGREGGCRGLHGLDVGAIELLERDDLLAGAELGRYGASVVLSHRLNEDRLARWA